MGVFLETYDDHLKSRDWATRAMAVICLARIDDVRTTERLLKVLDRDAAPVVRAFAWECLHARNRRLAGEQRDQWYRAGMKLAVKGELRGQLRAGMVLLAAERASTGQGRALFGKFFGTTNSQKQSDATTLSALRTALGAWRDPLLARSMLRAMSNLNDAWRAEYILGGLARRVRSSGKYRKEGSTVMWNKTSAAWSDWLAKAKLKSATTNVRAYSGTSPLVGAPRRITDPTDPKWRKDLELAKLHLEKLDVVFVVDSTGSMGSVLRWLRGDVVKMLRAFGMISREPRIGLTFFRDHGDEYLTRSVPLTGDGRRLVQAMDDVQAKGGGDIPEAVYDGLAAALKKHPWTHAPRAHKVIVLIGDAPPHEKDMLRVEKLITGAAAKGFRVHCLEFSTRRGGKVGDFGKIASWGGGKSMVSGFRGAGGGLWQAGPSNQIVSEVLLDVVNEDYRDRLQPFVNILLEYCDMPTPEIRRPFGPPKPRKGPRKPWDPQKQ